MNASTITLKTGAEGPHHDPYHYDELTVKRQDGRKVTLHSGLGVWLKVKTAEGRKIELSESDVKAGRLAELFEYHAGITLSAAHKALDGPERARVKAHFRKCGNSGFIATTGYPGESFDYCEKCGFVAGYSFDRSAVE